VFFGIASYLPDQQKPFTTKGTKGRKGKPAEVAAKME
jgi:hypothetical protein